MITIYLYHVLVPVNISAIPSSKPWISKEIQYIRNGTEPLDNSGTPDGPSFQFIPVELGKIPKAYILIFESTLKTLRIQVSKTSYFDVSQGWQEQYTNFCQGYTEWDSSLEKHVSTHPKDKMIKALQAMQTLGQHICILCTIKQNSECDSTF